MRFSEDVSKWETERLSVLTDYISRGITPKYTDDSDRSILVVNQRCIREGKVLFEDARRHDIEKKKVNEEKLLRDLDVLVNSTGVGTLGRVSQIQKVVEPTTVDSHVTIVRGNSDYIDRVYLGYAIKAQQSIIENMAEGSTGQTELSRKRLGEEIIIGFPTDKQEQKAIAHILSTLDDKIEVNNQINKTLENMAQAIFKQWFVDFEFPNEEGEPYKSSGGEMVESELGMIPKGWGVRRIGDECFCSLGGTPSRQKSDYWNGDIPWVNSGEVNNFRIYKPSEYITKLGLEKSATKLLKKKTTVLAITGATLGQVSLLEIDTCTNQSVVGISENDKVSHVYIYPYVKSVIKKIIGNQTGGAQQHINKGNVEDTKLLIPNKKVLNAYTKLVRPQYDLISSICFENELLTRLRDSLIPKLMSGEIRVSLDAEDDAS